MSAATVGRRGRGRELSVRDKLRADGWVVFRAHLSVADLIALKDGERPRLIEVKSTSTRGPYNDFLPDDRRKLSEAAAQAGADALLAWWPLRRPLQWLPEQDWPT